MTGINKGKPLSCAECHNVPGSVRTAGHIDTDDPAELLMANYLSNLTTNVPGTTYYDSGQPLVDPNPTYNASTFSCSSTYCHGTFKNGNSTNVVTWINSSTSVCGTCHGDPSKSTLAQKALPKTASEGGNHPNNTSCSTCHGGVVNASLQFINATKHIDGRLNLVGSDILY